MFYRGVGVTGGVGCLLVVLAQQGQGIHKSDEFITEQVYDEFKKFVYQQVLAHAPHLHTGRHRAHGLRLAGWLLLVRVVRWTRVR